MRPIGFHLVFRLEGDRVLAPSPASRRVLARQLARLSEAFLVVSWRVADTHLHLVGLLTAAELDELARRLRIALAQTLHPGVPLLLTVRKPILDQWHLVEAFHYVLRQDLRHAVVTDPFHEASSLTDVLALRVLAPAFAERVRERLPRLQRAELLAHLGLDALAEEVHADHLAEAACAAFALPDLRGRGAEAVAARSAAVHAASELGTIGVAERLEITRQTAWALARAPPQVRNVRAVRLQMALRAARPASAAFVREPSSEYVRQTSTSIELA